MLNVVNSNDIEILDTLTVAKLLGEDVRTIQNKAKKGFYPKYVCNKHGRCYIFNKQELLKFLFPKA